jgi:hypothetical protein
MFHSALLCGKVRVLCGKKNRYEEQCSINKELKAEECDAREVK